MKQSELEEHIYILNKEMGEVQTKCNSIYQVMQIMITLNSATIVLIVSHILKIV